MARLYLLVSRILGWGAGLSMALVFGIIFFNSLRRYTVGQSVQWGEELPVYVAIFGVMFGISLAYMQDRHIRFTILIDLLNPRCKLRLFAICDVAMMATGVLLVISGLAFMARRGDTMSSGMFGAARWLVNTTGIESFTTLGTLGVYQFALILGGGMITLTAFLKFIERVIALREG